MIETNMKLKEVEEGEYQVEGTSVDMIDLCRDIHLSDMDELTEWLMKEENLILALSAIDIVKDIISENEGLLPPIIFEFMYEDMKNKFLEALTNIAMDMEVSSEKKLKMLEIASGTVDKIADVYPN